MAKWDNKLLYPIMISSNGKKTPIITKAKTYTVCSHKIIYQYRNFLK